MTRQSAFLWCVVGVVLCGGFGWGIRRSLVYVSKSTISAPSEQALSVFSYPAEVTGYGKAGQRVTKFDAHPNFMIPAFDGYLLGSDGGEWGGQLVFQDHSKVLHRILDRNVRGIFRMPFGVIVFTGLAHLRMSTGAIYQIAPSANGVLKAFRILDLKGSPDRIRWTTDGDLVFEVVTYTRRSRFSIFPSDSKHCLLLDRTGKFQGQLCMAVVD